MAGGIVRITDPNSCGGKPMNGVTSVRVNGIPVVVSGASVSPHTNYDPPHTTARTMTTNTSVKAGGRPIVTASDVDTCGHTRLNASTNVRIG
jgi:uncharacterized Zn-binding protein involved in type VI secretion